MATTTTATQQECRLWRGTDGKFQVEAVYIGLFQNTKAKLLKKGGGMIAVPLDRLSPQDNAYIQAQLKRLNDTPPPVQVHVEQKENKPPNDCSVVRQALAATRDIQDELSPVDVGPGTRVLDDAREGGNAVSVENNHSGRQRPHPLSPSHHAQFVPKTPYRAPQHLFDLPRNVLSRIVSHVDVRTRIRLLWTSRYFHPLVLHPAAWASVWFLPENLSNVNCATIYTLVDFMIRFRLCTAVRSVVLDGSMVDANAVVHILVRFPHLQMLSIQGCWQVHSFVLGGKLKHIAATQPGIRLQLSEFRVGKVLKRGLTKQEKQKYAGNTAVPQSFGQDIDMIQNILSRLAYHQVKVDCYLCRFCNIGSAQATLTCAACGPVAVQKCQSCAPRCDRCSLRVCGLNTCHDPSIQLQGASCGRCHKVIALCNTSNPECVAARKPCPQCDQMYHRRCRAEDDTFVSNQCTRCGTVACPKCELTRCSGKCQGQWCTACVGQVAIGHCKCLVLQTSSGGKVRKRHVCHQCQLKCRRCGVDSFCERCIKVHASQCREIKKKR